MPEHTRHVGLNNYDIPYRSLVPPDVEKSQMSEPSLL